MLKHIILLTGIALVLAAAWGCDDRGNGIQPVDLGELEGWYGRDPSSEHVFPADLTFQLRNPREQLLGSVYWPPEAAAMPPQHPMPLLVLLAPEGGNRFYYFKAGLNELVRELTAAGEIQPMVIYCMANDQTFGGYFYADSKPAGHYDSIFQYIPDYPLGKDDLLDYLHRFYPATIMDAAKRGIGGVGQGAYGAFRAVIKNPGLYSSISVTDGPLDFNGSTNDRGLLALFDDVMAEQHARYALNPEMDDSEPPQPLPFNFRRHFDSSYTMPLSQMIIGGAMAFSPNDDSITYTRRVDTTRDPAGNIIATTLRLLDVVQYRISDTLTDSSTFISDLIKASQITTRSLELDFHLPFDGNLNINDAIWDRWMANNLEDMHGPAAGPLDGVSMWFGTNPNAKWGYNDMTRSWIEFLQPLYESIEVYQYSSFQEEPIVGDEYLFDILREMLIFHSNNFGD